jgi:cobalt/nickel transport system permease protein
MLASPALLHIPDGFLTPVVAALGWAIAVVVLVLGLRRTGRQLGDRMVPVMGVLAAFIFAGQAINFPVASGTSGHLIGAALAAIVLGPWASLVVMTVVIGTQALLLQDGGLIALGWNVVNMGALAAFSGYASYRGVVRVAGEHATARLGGAFAAAWGSVEAGAIATTLELAASGTTDINLALPAMTSVHALIGLGEGLVTVGALTLLIASRPEILRQGEGPPGGVQAAFVLAASSWHCSWRWRRRWPPPAPTDCRRWHWPWGSPAGSRRPASGLRPTISYPVSEMQRWLRSPPSPSVPSWCLPPPSPSDCSAGAAAATRADGCTCTWPIATGQEPASSIAWTRASRFCSS